MDCIIKKYENCFKSHPELPALTDYLSGRTLSYREMAARIGSLHALLRKEGVEPADKVALIGRNGVDWICTYIGVVTYGAVIVPILADFNPADVAGIVTHSDAKLLFGDESILAKIDKEALESVRKIITLEELAAVPADEAFDVSKINYYPAKPDDPIIISYTSGTSGASKGVIIPVRAIDMNVQFAVDHNFHFEGSRVLALLPLAHAYGCAFDMLTPLSVGSHINVLGKIPTPAILLKAMGEVKPHLICTVPLVMEKIVRKSVLPKLDKGPVKILRHIPLIDLIIYRKVRASLLEAFGGCVKEVNMGGAALAKDVEKFLKKARFPFTVGYGMTETAPLIGYEVWRKFKKGSCGKLLPGMSVKVEEGGWKKGIGEICVKGPNVMLGYYKNPEATAEAIRDGWLHTGDVGLVAPDGTIYLKGRCKNMILTSSGQNIYPEEVESKLNNLPGVAESLVYEKDGHLYALVVPEGDLEKVDYEKYKILMKENLKILNLVVAPYEKVSEIKLCSEPFEKTPKQSIRRFLYPAAAKIVK